MNETQLRLECLKLAHVNGRSEAEVISRAKVYEGYVLGDKANEKSAVQSDGAEAQKAETQSNAKPHHKNKKSGNLDSLI